MTTGDSLAIERGTVYLSHLSKVFKPPKFPRESKIYDLRWDFGGRGPYLRLSQDIAKRTALY